MHLNIEQNKVLIRKTTLCTKLDISISGLDKLHKKDPTFPRPIKDGDTRQAAVFYVAAEVDAWLKSKIEVRDAAQAGGASA